MRLYLQVNVNQEVYSRYAHQTGICHVDPELQRCLSAWCPVPTDQGWRNCGAEERASGLP